MLLLGFTKDLDLNPGLHLFSFNDTQHPILVFNSRNDNLCLRILVLVLLLLCNKVGIIGLQATGLVHLAASKNPLKIVTEGCDIARGCLVELHIT